MADSLAPRSACATRSAPLRPYSCMSTPPSSSSRSTAATQRGLPAGCPSRRSRSGSGDSTRPSWSSPPRSDHASAPSRWEPTCGWRRPWLDRGLCARALPRPVRRRPLRQGVRQRRPHLHLFQCSPSFLRLLVHASCSPVIPCCTSRVRARSYEAGLQSSRRGLRSARAWI
eukprot:6677001-Alexandrium_andersonii.AAC.1